MFNPQPKSKDRPKPENLIPVASYRVNYLSKAKKKNKFNATKIDFNGVRYDSKLEARVAEDLEFLRLSGVLIEIKRQVKIPLMVNDVLITTYYCDLFVSPLRSCQASKMVAIICENKVLLLENVLVDFCGIG